MRHIGRDIAYGWRRLRASPVFTAFAVASLAIGIGATTAIYAAVHTFLAPPPGVRAANEIVNVAHTWYGSVPIFGISLPDFEDYRARQQTMRHVSAWGQVRQMLAANGQTYSSFGEVVSGDYFTLLGADVAAGRQLQPADDRPDAPPVCVLGYRAWQRLFPGGDDAVGAPVKVNGHTFIVAGVAAREFKGQFGNGLVPTAAWVPLASAALFPELGGAADLRDRNHRWLRVQGRLLAGTPIETVRAEVTTIAGQLDLEAPIGDRGPDAETLKSARNSRPWIVRPLADVMRADPLIAGVAKAVLIALVLVLLIACTNLANLMLARVSLRRHELAVRLALGAARGRLMAEGLIEVLILAVAGGLAGLGLAKALSVMLRNDFDIGNGAKLFLEPRIDLPVLGVCMGATLLALLAAGLVPAWLAARADVRGALASGNAQSAGPRWRGRRLLIAGQVAVSVALLAIAALFIGEMRSQGRKDSGLDLDRIAVAEVDFKMQNIDETRTRQIVAAVTAEFSHRPGVESVAVSSGLPVGLMTPGVVVGVTDSSRQIFGSFMASTPEIFRTLGVTIVAGRAFEDRDVAGSQPVVVLNETAARVFGGASVVGQQVPVQRRRWVGEDAPPVQLRTVIGVAADSDADQVGLRRAGVIYVPLEQQFERRLVFSVRTTGAPEDLVGDLRKTIAGAAPDVGIEVIGTGTAVAGPSSTFAQITASVSGALGGFGLVLALAGLYGVLSHVVSRRTREIGVRLTLGATPNQIQTLMLREGLSPVLLGVLLGAGLAVMARLSLQPMFESLMPALDVMALGFVPLLLLAAGALASIVPARRAARVNPNVALREL